MEPTTAVAVSRRSAGLTASRGRLHRGPTRSGYSADKVVPSIPSRYETILRAGSNESDGFASRTRRFPAQLIETPAPTAYTPQQATATDPSFSKKGYSIGFVSKTRRFPRGYGKTASPGPGRYDAAQAANAAHDARSHRVGNSPGFCRPLAVASGSSLDRARAPGPNAYSAVYEPALRYQYNRSAAFASTSRRSALITTSAQNADVPAFYGNANESIAETLATKPGAGAAFASLSERDVFRDRLGNPPPGAYDIASSLDTGLPSAASASTTLRVPTSPRVPLAPLLPSQKRTWDRKVLSTGETPGPGAYDLPGALQVDVPEVSEASAPFGTNAVRRSPVTEGPGPADYKLRDQRMFGARKPPFVISREWK